MKQIAVLMSVYTEPLGYLRDAVESTLVSLEGFDYQFILVVDNPFISKDVLGYIDALPATVDVVFNSENIGLSSSLNVGLKKIESKYIARMDADDVCLKDRLRRQYEFMEENPDVALVGASLIKIDDVGKEIGRTLSYGGRFRGVSNRSPLYYGTLCFHPTWFIRSAVLKKEKYLPLPSSQDLELQFRLLAKGYILANIPTELLAYRISNSSISLRSGWTQSVIRRALNDLYRRRSNSSVVSFSEINDRIECYEQKTLTKKLFLLFHQFYTESLLKRRYGILFTLCIISPMHRYRMWLLAISKAKKYLGCTNEKSNVSM